MIKIRYIPDILLKKTHEEIDVEFNANYNLEDYLIESKFDYVDKRIIVSGKEETVLGRTIKKNDEIIIIPDVGLGGIGAAIGWVVSNFSTVVAVLSTVYSIYSAFQKPRIPTFSSMGSSGGIDEGSPSYGWDGAKTTMQVGTPVPVIYGEMQVGGNIINQHITNDGDKNYLNILLALSEGEIEDIDSIKINDNPIANFSGITTYKRYGTNDQTVIPNFEDAHNLYTINANLLKNSAYTYTTSNSDVETFKIHFTLPSGLFQVDGQKGVLSWDVVYKVEYKLHTDVAWTDLGSTTITATQQSAVRRVYEKTGLTAGQYDIRVTKTSNDSSLDPQKMGDLTLAQVDEIQTDDFIYPNTALLGIKALATDQLSGSTPNITCVVKGKKISIPNILNGATAVSWEDYYYDDVTSEYKLLSDDTVLSWDDTTYITAYSANPIWCARDFLINTRYGLGNYITTTNISLSNDLTESLYCEEKLDDGESGYEKRFRLDVVLDSVTRAFDLIHQLCSSFRGMPFYSNGAIKIVIDKPASSSQLFTMGNIIENTWAQSWKSTTESYNIIEIQFLDKENNYKQDTITYIDETAIAGGDELRKKSMRLFVTKKSYALREARYALKVSKYIDVTASFKTGINGIAMDVSEIASVSHDVPQWGFSGRILTGSTKTSIKLDRTVTVEAGETYKLRILFGDDDTQEEVTVLDGAGEYSTLTTNAFTKAPSRFDNYSFGVTSAVKKDFRLISVRRDSLHEVEVKLIEYDSDVYDDTVITIPDDKISALDVTIGDVRDLTLTERATILNDGSVAEKIYVDFNVPDESDSKVNSYKYARVYISDNAGTSWEIAGTTYKNQYIIEKGLVKDETYKIAVVSVSANEQANAIDDSPDESVSLDGKTDRPLGVDNFSATQEGNFIHFYNDANADLDIACYRYKLGSDWSTATTIAERVDAVDFLYPVGQIGEITYMVKAVDTSKNESAQPTYVTITTIPTFDASFINEFNPFAQCREYILSNVDLVRTEDAFSGYARDTFSLATADSWQTREAEAQTWQYQEENGGLVMDETYETSGYFEQTIAYNLGSVNKFKVVLDIDYTPIGKGGSVAVHISTKELIGDTWSAFALVDATTVYSARYIKFKYILGSTDANYPVRIYDGTIYLNAPNILFDEGNNVPVVSGGTDIVFKPDFQNTPAISAVPTDGTIGYCSVSAPTKDGFKVYVYDKDGLAVNANIDYIAKGN